jgi:hypothetical protein
MQKQLSVRGLQSRTGSFPRDFHESVENALGENLKTNLSRRDRQDREEPLLLILANFALLAVQDLTK